MIFDGLPERNSVRLISISVYSRPGKWRKQRNPTRRCPPSSAIDHRNPRPYVGLNVRPTEWTDNRGFEAMPKRAVELKVKQVEALRVPGLYSVGGVPGLQLQITETGARSWTYRYQLAGRRRDMGLGPTGIYTLAEARERAREARKLVDQGVDPIDRRKAEKRAGALDKARAMTFRQCSEAYIRAHAAAWKNAAHAKQWPSTLEMYVYPVFGALPVQVIDVSLVMKVAGAYLDREAGDREPSQGTDRKRAGLGQGAGLSQRRKPGPLAGSSRKLVAEEDEVAPSAASRRPCLYRVGRLYGGAAQARRPSRPRTGIHDPDLRPQR